jgi:hypothetical protein
LRVRHGFESRVTRVAIKCKTVLKPVYLLKNFESYGKDLRRGDINSARPEKDEKRGEKKKEKKRARKKEKRKTKKKEENGKPRDLEEIASKNGAHYLFSIIRKWRTKKHVPGDI